MYEKMVNCLNGKLKVGDLVISTPDDDYGCMIGTVLEIALLGTPEHDSENETHDVYVNFDAEYSPQRKREIERYFSTLYCEKKTVEELPLGMVIMDPDYLIRINELGKSRLKYLLSSEGAAAGFCFSELRRIVSAQKGESNAASVA